MINLSISKEALETFKSFRQLNKSDKEACGILIGSHSSDGRSLKIEIATKPGKKDVRKRTFYKVLSPHHNKILKKAFNESNFELVYLGTWHTHPEAAPSPSSIDIKDWKRQYKNNSHLFDKMVFIIVGTTDTFYWVIEKGILRKIKGGKNV